jgi:hypothetical protein
MVVLDGAPAPLLSPYCCAACEQRVVQTELASSIWIWLEDAAHEKQLYHARCWLAQRRAAVE